jgi:hypothetical protein
LQVDIFTNYGGEDAKRRSVSLRLKDRKETFKVADVDFWVRLRQMSLNLS